MAIRLEARFGPSIRVIGSLLFVVYHLGRVAIVIDFTKH